MNNYYLDIPVNQWDLYFKHIVNGIYGIKEGNYKVTRESNGIRKIEFNISNQIPLVNSLPATIISNKDIKYFENKQLLDAVEIAIIDAAKDSIVPGGVYYVDAIRIKVKPNEISPIVRQLARNLVITKFAYLGNDKYIITVKKYQSPLIIQSVNDNLYVTTYSNARTTFDVDDGYSYILSPLNSSWNEWRKIADISAPIHPPNII